MNVEEYTNKMNYLEGMIWSVVPSTLIGAFIGAMSTPPCLTGSTSKNEAFVNASCAVASGSGTAMLAGIIICYAGSSAYKKTLDGSISLEKDDKIAKKGMMTGSAVSSLAALFAGIAAYQYSSTDIQAPVNNNHSALIESAPANDSCLTPEIRQVIADASKRGAQLSCR